MFLHLGSDVVVPAKEVLIINDHKMMSSAINRKMLQKLREQGKVIEVTDETDEAKSYVFTTDKVYLSVISSVTLKKRLDSYRKENKKGMN